MAIVERIFADRGDAVGDVIMFGLTPRKYVKRGLALIEQYAIHTAVVRVERVHCDFCQAVAPGERTNSDRGDTVGDSDTGEAGALVERRVFDRGNAVSDGDPGQAGARPERLFSDRGDSESLNSIRDDHITAGTDIAGDGDLPSID